MSSESGTFDSYLEAGPYEQLSRVSSTFDEVCRIIGPLAVAETFAIDGPTNSGKTSLSTALLKRCEVECRPASFLPLDYFLFDRATRDDITKSISQKQHRVADYSLAAWDHESYGYYIVAAEEILNGASSAILTIPNAYDRQTGRRDHAQTVPVYSGGVLILEGVGLHVYHNQVPSVSIRTDVSDDNILLQRVLERGKHKLSGKKLDDDYLRKRHMAVDDEHTRYLRQCSRGYADFVVDSSTFDRIKVYKKV